MNKAQAATEWLKVEETLKEAKANGLNGVTLRVPIGLKSDMVDMLQDHGYNNIKIDINNPEYRELIYVYW